MIVLTKSAAEEAQKIIQENEMPVSAGVRLGVKSGGCSGLNYELDIVEDANDNDRVFEQHGLKLFCDPKSYLYLKGTQVDFHRTMTESGFKFSNPNAKRSCGCGTSFAV